MAESTTTRSSADLEHGLGGLPAIATEKTVAPQIRDFAPEKQSGQNAANDGQSGTLVDFDGPDDPGNPQNWSFGIKIWHAAVPGIAAWLA